MVVSLGQVGILFHPTKDSSFNDSDQLRSAQSASDECPDSGDDFTPSTTGEFRIHLSAQKLQ